MRNIYKISPFLTDIYIIKCDRPPQTSSKVGPPVNFIFLQIRIEHIFSFELVIVSSSYDTQKWSYDSLKYDMSEYVKPRKRALKFSFYTHFYLKIKNADFTGGLWWTVTNKNVLSPDLKWWREVAWRRSVGWELHSLCNRKLLSLPHSCPGCNFLLTHWGEQEYSQTYCITLFSLKLNAWITENSLTSKHIRPMNINFEAKILSVSPQLIIAC